MEFQIPSNVPNSLKGQVFDARGVLPTNSKYDWYKRTGIRNLINLTTIAVHHDALSKSSTSKYSDIELAKRIATSHINSEHNTKGGDPGNPYHIWIRNGVIYICNDLEAFTWGVASNNAYTVHICVSGNYAGIDTLEDRDRNALYAAILMTQSIVPSIIEVKGHKEITPTQCPGFEIRTVRTDLEQIKKEMMLQTELEQSEQAQYAKLYAAYGRITDLYKIATTNNPNQAEASRKLNIIVEAMIKNGLLTI